MVYTIIIVGFLHTDKYTYSMNEGTEGADALVHVMQRMVVIIHQRRQDTDHTTIFTFRWIQQRVKYSSHRENLYTLNPITPKGYYA